MGEPCFFGSKEVTGVKGMEGMAGCLRIKALAALRDFAALRESLAFPAKSRVLTGLVPPRAPSSQNPQRRSRFPKEALWGTLRLSGFA